MVLLDLFFMPATEAVIGACDVRGKAAERRKILRETEPKKTQKAQRRRLPNGTQE